MSVILVDVRYLGIAIRRGRKDARLQRHELARILKIDRRTMLRIEQGKESPSEDVMRKIICAGCCMLMVRGRR